MAHWEHKKTRKAIRSLGNELKGIAMTNAERAESGLENIRGDLGRQTEQIAAVSADLAAARAEIAELLANQDAAVAAEVDAKLGAIADSVDEIAAIVPEPAEPPVEEPPVEPAP